MIILEYLSHQVYLITLLHHILEAGETAETNSVFYCSKEVSVEPSLRRGIPKHH